MFNIPDAYKLDYQVNLKDFIPKVLKSKDKNIMSEFFDKSGRAIDDEEMIIHSDLV